LRDGADKAAGALLRRAVSLEETHGFAVGLGRVPFSHGDSGWATAFPPKHRFAQTTVLSGVHEALRSWDRRAVGCGTN